MALLDFLGIGGKLADLASEFIEDKDKANEFTFKLRNAINEADKAQIQVNKAAANHPSIFVAGARPFILWGCGFALLWTGLFSPFLIFIMVVGGVDPMVISSLPQPDLAFMMPVLMGLLGLGGLRTWEKQKGVHKNNMK